MKRIYAWIKYKQIKIRRKFNWPYAELKKRKKIYLPKDVC